MSSLRAGDIAIVVSLDLFAVFALASSFSRIVEQTSMHSLQI